MPSIRALFADPDLIEEGEDAEIDIDKVLDSVTDVLRDRGDTPGSEVSPTDAGEQSPPEGEVQTPEPQPSTISDAVDGEEGDEEEPEGENGLPPAPPAAHDPFAELPADRRAAILALDEALRSDPAKRDAIFGIMAGKAAPEAPRMPEEIEPGSVEAQLWQQQQDNAAALHEIRTGQRDQQIAFETQRANTAAVQACQSFGERYSGKLEQSDVIEIAKFAGQSGISTAFLNTADGKRDPAMAYNQALEHVLWTNEAFRTRVLGTGESETPPGEKPQAQDRKRKLHALSPSASPVSGPPAQRTPLESGADGRLTEKSRQSLVKELATDMARRSQGA